MKGNATETVKVCMMVDWMAVPSEDEEYEEIERDLIPLCKPIHENRFSFERRVFPHQLRNKRVDLYIIDFGGVLPGCDETIVGHFRELVQQIEDKPNTLFIIWTKMTKRWYTVALQEENPSQSLHIPHLQMGPPSNPPSYKPSPFQLHFLS